MLNIVLTEDIKSVLVDKNSVKKAEKEAKADQKLVSGAEAQAKVVMFSAEQWIKAGEFAKKKLMLGPIEESAIAIASKIPVKIPNSFQAQKLLELLEKLENEGFKM